MCLQNAFGDMDINHLYDLHLWMRNFIVMHDIRDNLKYWFMNDDKFIGSSDCVVCHCHVIATM